MAVKADINANTIKWGLIAGLAIWIVVKAGAGLNNLFSSFGGVANTLANATNSATRLADPILDPSKYLNPAYGSPEDRSPYNPFGAGPSGDQPLYQPNVAPDQTWQPGAIPGTDPASLPSGFWGYDSAGSPLPGPYAPGY